LIFAQPGYPGTAWNHQHVRLVHFGEALFGNEHPMGAWVAYHSAFLSDDLDFDIRQTRQDLDRPDDIQRCDVVEDECRYLHELIDRYSGFLR
jgi:hypothetical protein